MRNVLRSERGQGMVEYALIVAVIAIGVLAALTALGGQISTMFNFITSTLQHFQNQATTGAGLSA